MTLAGSPRRVMHVITGLGVGGAETQLAMLLTAGADRAADTTDQASDSIVVSLLPGGPHRETLAAAGIPVHDLGMARGRWRLRDVLRLTALIRRYRPTIVHSWLYHADLLATVALRISGRWHRTPLVWGVRCSDMDFARYSPGLRRVVRMCARLSSWPDVIVFNAEAGRTAHRSLGYRPHRAELIDNGIDTERFRPDPALRLLVRKELGVGPNVPLLAHVARVDPMKDHETFVRAWRRLEGVEALLIGRGTEALPPCPGLHPLGVRTDVHRLLGGCDVIVSSSAFGEGFSNVIAEGMAAGLPAVATDVGDAARIVGECGIIVPPRDAGALADAVRAILGESMAARLARRLAARARIESQFSIERAVSAHDRLYDSLA